MKLVKDNESLAEDKLLILYLLNKANKPLTNVQILKLLLEIKEVNYFYFQQFINDLENKKYVLYYKQGEDWLYEITPLGVKTIELTQNILPGILKFKTEQSIDNKLNTISNEIQIVSEYIPEKENAYTVKCKVIEGHTVLFELNMFAGSRELAKQISDNWKKNALSLYPKIINLLSN